MKGLPSFSIGQPRSHESGRQTLSSQTTILETTPSDFASQSRADETHYPLRTPAIIACRTNINDGMSLSSPLHHQRVKDNTIHSPQLRHLLTCCIQALTSNHGEITIKQIEPCCNYQPFWCRLHQTNLNKIQPCQKANHPQILHCSLCLLFIQSSTLGNSDEFNNHSIYWNPLQLYRSTRQTFHDLEQSRN